MNRMKQLAGIYPPEQLKKKYYNIPTEYLKEMEVLYRKAVAKQDVRRKERQSQQAATGENPKNS